MIGMTKLVRVKDPVWKELKERSGNVYSLGDTIYTLLRQTDERTTLSTSNKHRRFD